MLSVLKNRFIRFCIVGGINTAIDFSVFYLVFQILGTGVLLANALAFTAATINSYLLNKFWTFADPEPHSRRKVMLFAGVALSGLALSSLVISLLVLWVSPLVAKLLTIGVVLVWNFILNRMLVFRR